MLGTILDPIPAIILTVPVLLPVATDVYAIDPVHFGVVVCLNLTLGLLTPPGGHGAVHRRADDVASAPSASPG